MKKSDASQSNKIATFDDLKRALADYELKAGKKFLERREFETSIELISRSFGMVMTEMGLLRNSMDHLEQTVSAYSRGLIVMERKIDNLDDRVLALEQVK